MTGDREERMTLVLTVMHQELRTLLNTVVGYADLLEAGVSGPLNDVQREQLSRIHESGDRLAELMEELQVYTGIETARGFAGDAQPEAEGPSGAAPGEEGPPGPAPEDGGAAHA